MKYEHGLEFRNWRVMFITKAEINSLLQKLGYRLKVLGHYLHLLRREDQPLAAQGLRGANRICGLINLTSLSDGPAGGINLPLWGQRKRENTHTL